MVSVDDDDFDDYGRATSSPRVERWPPRRGAPASTSCSEMHAVGDRVRAGDRDARGCSAVRMRSSAGSWPSACQSARPQAR